MKKAIDKFSEQSDSYRKYKPTYPKELYEQILKHVGNRDKCLDCGMGNGQIAVELSKYFKEVYAADISRNQLKKAERMDNISYIVERAEKTGFKNNQFDLITVGQAFHWFDFDEFFKEAKRISNKNGIIAIWAYGMLHVSPDIDRLIDILYDDILGDYWNEERKYVDNQYETIEFDFDEIKEPKNLSITVY